MMCSFNPFNTIALHAPLGAINRARHRLYIACGAMRDHRAGLSEVPRCPFVGVLQYQPAADSRSAAASP